MKRQTRGQQKAENSRSVPSSSRSSRRTVRRTAKAAQYESERERKRSKTTPAASSRPPPTPSSSYDRLTPMMPRSPIASLLEQAKSKDAKSVVRQSSPNGKSKPDVRESKEKAMSPSKEKSPNTFNVKSPTSFKENSPSSFKENSPSSLKENSPSPSKKNLDFMFEKANRKDSEQKKIPARKANAVKSSSVRGRAKLELPGMLSSVAVSVLQAIDSQMKTTSTTFLRRGKDAESLQVSFPLKNTQVCDVDVFHLAQDPDITSNDSDLYAGYAILDLATQWTFWDRNSSKSWCALPAFTFELLKENPNYSTNTRLQKLFRFQGLHSGILNYEVIEMTIYYGAHFSKAFIIHPSLVLDRTWKIKDGDDDIAPSHHELQSARDIRVRSLYHTFCNAYCEIV
jgi:hypothetical protein